MQARYFAAYRLHGLASLPEDKDVELLALPELTAILTARPDEHCIHLDRQRALGTRALKSLNPGNPATSHEDEMVAVREARNRQGVGIFLILTSNTEISEPDLTHCADRGDFIVCVDGGTTTNLRNNVTTTITSVLAAVALSLPSNCSKAITIVGDVTYGIDQQQKPIYSLTFHAKANASVADTIDNRIIEGIRDHTTRLLGDKRLESVVNLLVYSYETKANELQSFIEAWAALEIFINKLFKEHYASNPT